MKNGLVSPALIPSQIYPCPWGSVSTNFSNIWAVLHLATSQFFIKAFTDIDSSFPTNKLVKRNDIYWLLTVCLTMLICLHLVISTKYLNKIYFLSVCIFDISKMWNSKILSNFINDQEPKCILISIICLPSLYFEEFVFSVWQIWIW